MIEHIGSQTREPIEDTENELLEFVEYLSGRDAILLNTENGIKELYIERVDYAGYVVVIDGKGFEFVRSLE